jgi:uncharacterized membrane protein
MKDNTKFHILMVSICIILLSTFFSGMYLQYHGEYWVSICGSIMAMVGLSWFIFIATIYSISFR